MATPDEIFRRHQRQVHLDFHNSPLIPDLASEFDAAEFARAMARAGVNSVTVFAKCHHGMCYFPARHGTPHPALGGRDLLGEQIEALHREGIRAPIYMSVAWDEDAAARFPQWRQLRRDGTYPGRGGPGNPGQWKYLNFLHPRLSGYIWKRRCARSLPATASEVDGFFFDIVFFHPDACWSETSRRFREAHGIDGRRSGQRRPIPVRRARERSRGGSPAAAWLSRRRARRFSTTLRARCPIDSSVGARARYPQMTHFEIESLPSGPWGYHHFPRLARAVAHWGAPGWE